MRIASLSLFALLAVTSTAPVRADTLRVAIPALPASLGVPFTAVGQPSSVTWSALFDGLTVISADGVLKPALAMTWTPVTPTRWRLALRPGVHFHDGTSLTAAAVVASLDILRSSEGRKFYLASEVKNFTAVRAIDPLTLEIETHDPDAVLPRRMSIIPIVSAAAWQAEGEAGFAQAPVGTGPYRVVDWGAKTGSAKFAAADSWRKPVAMTTLELIPLNAPLGRLQALLSGRVDIAARMNVEDISEAQGAGFHVASLPAPQVVSLTFRVADNPKSPIADVRVRQALTLAVNRSAMAQQILLGSVVPASQGTSAQTLGYNPDIAVPPYDPDRAKALLAAAGYPKGFALNADVVIGTSPADDLLYQQTVADLRKVGVTVTLRAIPYAVWLRRYTSGTWGDADMFSLIWDSSSFYDVIRVLSLASCDKTPPFFCDPALTPAFNAVGAEMNEQRRLPALRDLNARMVDLAPALWLATVTYHYGLSPRLNDVGLRNSGLVYETITAHP